MRAVVILLIGALIASLLIGFAVQSMDWCRDSEGFAKGFLGTIGLISMFTGVVVGVWAFWAASEGGES